MIGFPDFDDDDDDEDDFIRTMESELAHDVGGVDFISTMEDELNSELIRGIDALSSALPLSSLDNGLYLGNLSELEDATNTNDNTRHQRRRVRGKCKEGYTFGNIFESTWYTKFLAPDKNGKEGTRNITRRVSSGDRQGTFRSMFRLPLHKIEALADKMVDEGIITPTRRISSDMGVQIKAELHVMGALAVLGHGMPFRLCSIGSNISKEEHRIFFHRFIDYFFDNHEKYVYLPRDMDELKEVMGRYREVGLPGAMGSKDVVHVKWARAPAGDFNRCKGKQSYPSIAFQCISNFNRRILGVSRAQYGTRNDKSIVKRDHNVYKIRCGWYANVEWEHFTLDGDVVTDVGVYLICDNGYLRWPTSICPFMHADKTTMEGYFSTNIESVRKDVECVFGILKKRWRVLDHGFKFRSLEICEKVFFTCCCLHNEMLDMMESRSNRYRVGRGSAASDEGMWLGDGSDDVQFSLEVDKEINESRRVLSTQWHLRRRKLAEHLYYIRHQ